MRTSHLAPDQPPERPGLAPIRCQVRPLPKQETHPGRGGENEERCASAPSKATVGRARRGDFGNPAMSPFALLGEDEERSPAGTHTGRLARNEVNTEVVREGMCVMEIVRNAR